MKSVQYAIALLLGAACLVMAGMTLVTSRKNQQKQQELQNAAVQLQQVAVQLQNEAQTVAGTERISRDILTDLGNAALSNAQIRAMLGKHGYTLTTNQPAATAGAVPVVETKAVPPPAGATGGVPAVAPPPPAKSVSKQAEPVSVVTPPVSAPVEPATMKEKQP